MKKIQTACLSLLICALLALPGALADSITLSGKIIPAESARINAPVSGTVDTVNVTEGQKVKAGDPLYSMKTTKTYAEKDGTVTGVFGRPGDDAETVSVNYGAVLYLEGTSRYTVSASTDSAYGTMTAKYVHAGEKVWLVCRTNSGRKGTGTITAINGTGYTVEVDEGNFIPGDSVDIYRDEAYSYDQKVGRGSVSRTPPSAVTATGGIVRIAANDGDKVQRGDLLLETLDGTFDGYTMDGTEISAARDGIVGSISVTEGESIQKGSAAAVIYPTERMHTEAYIPEDYCNQIHEGDTVLIELATDTNRRYEGTVVLISSIATEGEEEVSYRIVAEFEPDDAVRFGMSALITAGEETEEDAEPAEKKEATEPAEEVKETEQSGRRERPEGRSAPSDAHRRERTESSESAAEETEGDNPSGNASEIQEDQ